MTALEQTQKDVDHLDSSQDTQSDNLDSLATLEDYHTEYEWLDDILMKQSSSPNPPVDYDVPPSLSHLDQKLSKLLSAFELAIGDTSALVDTSIEEIERGVPRLSLDLQLMKENALLLRYSLETIQANSQLPSQTHQDDFTRPPPTASPSSTLQPDPPGDETDEILSRLQTLDLIKERMELSRTVLREAEAWSTLESEVTGYLTDPIPSHFKAAERLAEAAKSMVVFQHTPEYEGRRGLMRSLQNELEASLSANLVKALGDKDVKRCKEFFEIFKMIEREGEFKNYYFGSRRSTISTLWSQASISPPSLSTSNLDNRPQTLPTFLAKHFYSSLIKLIQTELDFLPFIFPKPLETLTALLTTTIDQLQPSMSLQLVELMDSANILRSWPSLISCWNITEEAAWKIENLISQLDLKLKEEAGLDPPSLVVQPSDSGAGTSKLSRRTSLRRSISRLSGSRNGIDFSPLEDLSAPSSNQTISSIQNWETALYEPFIDLQCAYHEREVNYLRASKNAIIGTSGQFDLANQTTQKLINASQALPQCLESLFNLANSAMDRCEAFTHGYGLLGCLQAIDLMFSEYLDTSRQTLIAEREGHEKKKIDVGFKDIGGQVKANQFSSRSSDHQRLDLEGLDYSSEDWEIFQQGLKLLAACKMTHDKLCAYEKKSSSHIFHMVTRLRQNSNETVAINEDLQVIRIKLSKGAKVLLKESNLNSAALWEIFDSMQPLDQSPSSNLTHAKDTAMSLLNKRRFSSATKPSPTPQSHSLYPKTNLAFSKLIRECQNMVQSVILLPLLKQVQDYPSLSLWSQSENELHKMTHMNSISTIDLKILDQFSKSPTELVSKLGEGLFNLPRLFETYTTVEGDALSFSLETLPFINYEEFLANWLEYHKSNESDALNIPENKSPPFSSEMVISTWLSSLTLAVVNQITEHTIPSLISRQKLSPSAKSQLLIDLDYLNNVVKALDADTDALEKMQERLQLLP
ncbi:hypothetical protein O181_021948 [Austropuccinia psidii MF-1]|uniref:Conserved oligomeric Golgi complex subunit 7 n=1 Tax=Austropuccinia psidii MF-1 TaxID=1389203 RepID=A0A9Q3CFV3_9BASI|nr:hypothetical protein [Austropuccinia psidii MF-1]